ncbi:hypothetical protein Tco_0003887 [Tanacetum coccineum]
MRLLQPPTRTYPTHILTQKVFSNMKRVSRGYSGIDFSLFPTMISAPETSPSRITSSPSLSPQHTPVSTPSTLQPPNTQPTPDVEEAVLMPHKSPLHSVHSLGRDEGSLSLSELTDEGTSWIQEDIEIQEKISDDTEVVLKEEEPTELVEDQGSGEKGEKEFSTVGAEHSTVIPEVSIAAANLVYIRKSALKMKDKGKAFMEEDKSVQEKTKKQLEQERLRHEEVIRLQEQIDEEYHALQNRPYSVAKVRNNMCIYLKNQGGFKMSHFKGMSYEEIRPIFEKKRDDSSKPAEGRRKKTLARKRASGKDSEESMKKQKLEDDTKKEDLKSYLDIIPGDDVAIDIGSLAAMYPIVDWKTYVLAENFMYYQIFRANGSSKNYKIFRMLDDFDRLDVLHLHRLVKARYMTSSPEGYNLMLWEI